MRVLEDIVRLFNLDKFARPLPMPLSNPRTVFLRVTPDHALLCCPLDEEAMEVVAERACRGRLFLGIARRLSTCPLVRIRIELFTALLLVCCDVVT